MCYILVIFESWRDANLPRRLFNTWYLPFIGQFSEADAAEGKIPHEPALATTSKAAIDGSR